MREDRPALNISEIGKNFNKVAKRVRAQRVLYATRRGKEVFALVDIEFMDAVLEKLEHRWVEEYAD